MTFDVVFGNNVECGGGAILQAAGPGLLEEGLSWAGKPDQILPMTFDAESKRVLLSASREVQGDH
ncbi:MAG: hypothetical protein AAF222_09660 [Pseudomonadota bacterium]